MSSPVTVYRRLDVKKLSPEARSYFEQNEGFSHDDPEPLLVHDRARDVELTREIVEATKCFVLLGLEDEILAEYQSLAVAEKVAASARVVFDLEIEEE